MASWDECEIECKLILSNNVPDGTAKCWTALPQVQRTKQVEVATMPAGGGNNYLQVIEDLLLHLHGPLLVQGLLLDTAEDIGDDAQR